MTVFVPTSLLQASDSQTVIDAVYFVVRALRNVLRNYSEVEVSTESSPKAHELAETALKEIQKTEGESIKTMERSKIASYLTALQEFVSAQASPHSPSSRIEAEQFLQEMRQRKV